MSLTEIATLFNLTGIAAVLFLSLVMLRRHPSGFFRTWSGGYASMFGMLVLDLAGTVFSRSAPLVGLEMFFALMTAGCFLRLGRELRGRSLDLRLYGLVSLVLALVGVGLTLGGIPFALLSLPVVLVLVVVELRLGVMLIRRGVNGTPAPWLGIPFVLCATAVITYPFILSTPWFWVGFWLTGLLNILVGVGMALLLLESTLEHLQAQHQQLIRLDQLKRSFLSTVSHELRTPLTGMIGNLEFLEDGIGGPLTSAQTQYLQEVQRGASQLSELVESLLDTVQMESGALRVKHEPVDLDPLLHQAQHAMGALAAQKDLTLELSLPDDLPMVQADALRVSQVLSNLVSNAVKFTPAGGHIVISAAVWEQEVRIAVTDTGVGIPEEALGRVFEPFFQVDGTLTRQYRGSGLGLPIVKTLVEAMAGAVSVESRLGEGSTFSFSLPLANVPVVPVSS